MSTCGSSAKAQVNNIVFGVIHEVIDSELQICYTAVVNKYVYL